MSHLTTHKTKLSDRRRMERLAKQFGWTVRKTANFTNQYSGQSVADAAVLTDQAGQTKMVVGPDGTVHTDSYYMGRDHQKFMQAYAADHIREKAVGAGGMVSGQKVDPKTGELILEVQFA